MRTTRVFIRVWHLKFSITNLISANDVPNEEVFGNNLARLRELKDKYDPDNMFNKWHNIKSPIEISR